MKLAWSKWNSGGGCMIYSFDYASSDHKAYSIQVSDEAVVAVDLSSEEYWELQDADEEVLHALVPIIWYNEGKSISTLLCPYTGQELADLIEQDVHEIWAQYD